MLQDISQYAVCVIRVMVCTVVVCSTQEFRLCVNIVLKRILLLENVRSQ